MADTKSGVGNVTKMAGLAAAAIPVVKATRKALGLPAISLKTLGGLAPNKKDAERQANINNFVAALQDQDPANDAAALSGLHGAATSWAGGGKEMASNALRSLGLPAQGAVSPSVVGGPAGAAGAAPAPEGGGWLDSVGGALRRLNGGKALTLGNAVGGAARNVGGALGGIGGAVGSALGGLGGFARDHAGELAGAGVAALGIPEMNRANRYRDQALGALPGEAALGLPGTLDVTAGGAVNPEDSARLGRYRSLTDQSLEGLQGPSRSALAATALDDFNTQQGRMGDAAFRRATQMAAAKGGLGSGMLTSSYGDVATQLAEREGAFRNELARDVSEGDISDRFRRLGVTADLEGGVSAEEAARRGELRGERGYATGIEEGNIERRLGAGEDVFRRGLARGGAYGQAADAADARAAGLINAGAGLAAGSAANRAYGAGMAPRAAVAAPQAPGAVGMVGGQVAPILGGTLRPLPPVAGAVAPTAPTAVSPSLGLAGGPAATVDAAGRTSRAMTPAEVAAAAQARAGSTGTARLMGGAPATPHVQPLVNMQVPLPPAGPAAVPTIGAPKPARPLVPTARRRLTAVAGGL